VQPRFGLAQFELRPPDNHALAMAQKLLQHLA